MMNDILLTHLAMYFYRKRYTNDISRLVSRLCKRRQNVTNLLLSSSPEQQRPDDFTRSFRFSHSPLNLIIVFGALRVLSAIGKDFQFSFA